MDTNPPDDQNWWYLAAEETKPVGWAFFKQPSGTSIFAENLENLPENYYQRITAGKDADWVKVYVEGEYGFVTEGKAVWPMYRDHIHCSKSPIEPIKDVPILIAADFGLTPAAVIGQKLVDGRWRILDEVCTDSCGVIRFAELLGQYIREHFPNNEVGECYGDPAGSARAFSDEKTAFDIMNAYTPWRWRPAPSNDFLTRREVVANAFNRLVDGEPGLLLSPKAATIRKGCAGGYHFKFVKNGSGEQVHEAPAKNHMSHPCEALQYLLLGGGEYHVALKKMRKGQRRQHVALDMDYPVFG